MMKMVLGAFAALFCGSAMAEPLSTLGFIVADSLLTTGATGAISGLTAAGTALASGAAGLIGAKMGSKKQSHQGAQSVMPTSDDEAVKRAKQRQVAEIQARSGRASTILSDGGKLGG